MKRFISIIITLSLVVCGLGMAAYAAGETYKTDVEHIGQYTDAEGNNTEYYEVKVPSVMAPGDDSEVTATGHWPTNRQLVVTAPTSVTLTCDLDSTTKDLAVTFAGIELVGSNTEEMETAVDISIADIEDALFGTWTGTLTYEVTMEDVTAD